MSNRIQDDRKSRQIQREEQNKSNQNVQQSQSRGFIGKFKDYLSYVSKKFYGKDSQRQELEEEIDIEDRLLYDGISSQPKAKSPMKKELPSRASYNSMISQTQAQKFTPQKFIYNRNSRWNQIQRVNKVSQRVHLMLANLQDKVDSPDTKPHIFAKEDKIIQCQCFYKHQPYKAIKKQQGQLNQANSRLDTKIKIGDPMKYFKDHRESVNQSITSGIFGSNQQEDTIKPKEDIFEKYKELLVFTAQDQADLHNRSKVDSSLSSSSRQKLLKQQSHELDSKIEKEIQNKILQNVKDALIENEYQRQSGGLIDEKEPVKISISNNSKQKQSPQIQPQQQTISPIKINVKSPQKQDKFSSQIPTQQNQKESSGNFSQKSSLQKNVPPEQFQQQQNQLISPRYYQEQKKQSVSQIQKGTQIDDNSPNFKEQQLMSAKKDDHLIKKVNLIGTLSYKPNLEIKTLDLDIDQQNIKKDLFQVNETKDFLTAYQEFKEEQKPNQIQERNSNPFMTSSSYEFLPTWGNSTLQNATSQIVNQYPVAPQYQTQSQVVVQQPMLFNNQSSQNLFGGQKDSQNLFEQVQQSNIQTNNNSSSLFSQPVPNSIFHQPSQNTNNSSMIADRGYDNFQQSYNPFLSQPQIQQNLPQNQMQNLPQNQMQNQVSNQQTQPTNVFPWSNQYSNVAYNQNYVNESSRQNQNNTNANTRLSSMSFGNQQENQMFGWQNSQQQPPSFIGGRQSFTQDDDLNQAASLFTAVGVKPQQQQQQVQQISLFDDQSQQQLGNQSLQGNSGVNRKTNSEQEKKKINLLKQNMRSNNSNLRID